MSTTMKPNSTTDVVIDMLATSLGKVTISPQPARRPAPIRHCMKCPYNVGGDNGLCATCDPNHWWWGKK